MTCGIVFAVVSGVARVSAAYTPRDPSAGVLYRIVRDHLETFRAQAAGLRGGEGLPRFVEEEFRAFLRCGWLAGGFARFQCGGCGRDHLVAFSCKGRGFCPSCGGRRMAERAAHLVDRVLPDVPVRQWVLSLPYRVRYALAWDHDACRLVVRALVRAVERHYRSQAEACGASHARGGAVAIVQRFGGSLNLNVHVHALVLDGVYAPGAGGRLRFHAAPTVTTADVADVLAAIVPAVMRLLERRGLAAAEEGSSDRFAESSPLLAGLAAASVQGIVALGPTPGAHPRRLGTALDGGAPGFEPAACQARWEGFDLHAGLRVADGQRDRLERVCRYALRPPLSEERLAIDAQGQVVLQLRRPWANGTTTLVFEPAALLERLAVLVPRPRINLVLYHGVLGARAAWRREVVAGATPSVPGVEEAATPEGGGRGWRWADLMRRVFAFDVLACPRCGGRLRLIAVLEASAVTVRILEHLELPTEVPAARPSRAPPADWVA